MKQKGTWGGARLGAGRPPGKSESARTSRLVVMLSAAEYEKVKKHAALMGIPTGTLGYKLLGPRIKRLGG